MSVYVDTGTIVIGRDLMCHLWADTLEELLAMVDRIGVQRRWLQKPPKASWVHFDIAQSKRKLAVEAGAIETDMFGPAEYVARLRGNTAILERIARSRALRAEPRPLSPPNTWIS